MTYVKQCLVILTVNFIVLGAVLGIRIGIDEYKYKVLKDRTDVIVRHCSKVCTKWDRTVEISETFGLEIVMCKCK